MKLKLLIFFYRSAQIANITILTSLSILTHFEYVGTCGNSKYADNNIFIYLSNLINIRYQKRRITSAGDMHNSLSD